MYKVIDRRNGIPAASPGDKSYKSVEYSPDFYKISSTLPAVNFGWEFLYTFHKDKFIFVYSVKYVKYV